VLCHHRQEFFLWGQRQFQYCLPEYTNVLLGRDPSVPAERAGKFRVCRGARTEFVDNWRQVVRGRTLLLFAVPGEPVSIFADRLDVAGAVVVPGTHDGVYELRAP
jgi:hypothetical protein